MTGILSMLIGQIYGGSTPVITDPYFDYTTLLLPGNGTNGAQNNTFLDGSTNNFTITRNGNTTQGTFSPFSQTGWGNYFDGTGDYLTAADNASFDLGAADWTIELWAYFNSVSGEKGLISHFAAGTPNAGYTLRLSTSNSPSGLRLVCSGSSDIILQAAWTPVVGTWYHIAAVRNSGTLYIYVNGQQIGSTSIAITIGNPSTLFAVGTAQTVASSDFNGYISNVRLVKGTAVYTADFTPPTAPLTAISGTSLLTCQSNRFKDNSTNNFTITVNGNTSVQAFSPFNPTASWSAATYGGSGYFDGSGDYLSIASNAALQFDGQFTIECWYYPKTLATYDALIVTSNDASSTNGIGIFLKASGGIQLYNYVTNTTIFDTSSGVIANAWNHIAVTRNSSNGIDLWVNGASQGTTQTVSSNFNSTTPTRIGLSTTSAQDCDGYISSVRMIKGASVYSGAFTPPSLAPLTIAGSTSAAAYPSTTNVNTSFASSATSLLLNFTNAGIYDATSKNDLETVGNAQISTTQSKWGGSSMAFDGTGDYLLSPDQPIQRIGTGNFTIECWVYRNSSGTYGLVGKGTGTTGWLLSLNSSNQVVFTYGSSTITSTGTVSATTWTYIAVVREGTGTNQTKIYINGSNDGTGTVSTDFNQTNSLYVGADRTGGSNANVYLQDLRISNYARTITASPTAAFPTL